MSSLWSGSSANSSLAWSLGDAGKGRFHIRFPLDLGWYREQSCTRFRSLQHRKERRGFQHEFIVLRLVDGSICRIERMGDPEARFNAISAEGSTAYDVAQSFADDSSPDACLGTSDIVADIEFPHELDLMDVLRICRAIHEGEKTCNYTLQSYNCYFFALAIQAVLTRLVAGWKEFTSDAWNSSLDEGLSALSYLYNGAPSAQVRWPFILRIYSLLGPGIEWPASLLLLNLKRDLLDPKLVREVNRARTTVLWHSNVELAVGHVSCEKIRDTMGCILCGHELGSTRANSTGNNELGFAESQCKGLLSVLVSRAISRHKQARPAPKLKRLWEHMNLFQTFKLFSSAAQSLRNLNFRRAAKLPLSNQHSRPEFSSAQQIPGQWLMYAKSLAMWVLLVTLGLFWIVPLDFMQPRRGVSVEEELEQTLITLESPKQNGCTTDLTPMVKKLRALVDTKEPVLWREWPWAHMCEQINRRVMELVLDEESALQVTFQGDDTRTVSLSLFQKYLLNRIRLHSQRVESFKLGHAIYIQDDLEDKISQVWVLVRNDDIPIQSDGSSPSRLAYSDTPLTSKLSEPPFVSQPFVGDPVPRAQLQKGVNYYGVAHKQGDLVQNDDISTWPNGDSRSRLLYPDAPVRSKPPFVSQYVVDHPAPRALLQEWADRHRVTLQWIDTAKVQKGITQWISYPIIQEYPYPEFPGSGIRKADSRNQAAKMIIESRGTLDKACCPPWY